MKKIVFATSLLVLSFVAISQDNMFVIYSMKGNISVISNKTETKAKIGGILENDAVIKVPAGSIATLICNEARMFSLNKPGNYPIGSLKDSCVVSKSSVNANYVKYIWSEFTKAHGSPEKNRKNYMANVGAVGRGDINNVWVDPRLDSVNYVSGTIPLSWKAYTEAEEFDFKLYDDSKTKVLLAKTVKKKHVDISELLKLIQPGKIYYWSATVKGEPENADRKYVHYVTKDNYVSFYNSVKQHDASETDAEMNFRLGFVLEENHYIAEAFNHYMKATQLDPTNSLYRFTFMSFKKDFEIK
ncbi:MAG: hypothetical protein E6H08_00950 [Bacteroidetes bacterium]|nr:MAG: hypothetical protein E6H08_00950 [Bacteroidota bacterium]